MEKYDDNSSLKSYSSDAKSHQRNPLKGHLQMFKLFIKGLSLDNQTVKDVHDLVQQDKTYAPLLSEVLTIQKAQRADYQWYLDILYDIIESENKRLKSIPPEKQDTVYNKEWERSVQEAMDFVRSLNVQVSPRQSLKVQESPQQTVSPVAALEAGVDSVSGPEDKGDSNFNSGDDLGTCLVTDFEQKDDGFVFGQDDDADPSLMDFSLDENESESRRHSLAGKTGYVLGKIARWITNKISAK